MTVGQILIKPLLTEKTSLMMENNNVYAFKVNKAANKNQICKAIENQFNVKVVSINTTNMASASKRMGKFQFKAPSFKKAYVKIQAGQKIELFKGV